MLRAFMMLSGEVTKFCKKPIIAHKLPQAAYNYWTAVNLSCDCFHLAKQMRFFYICSNRRDILIKNESSQKSDLSRNTPRSQRIPKRWGICIAALIVILLTWLTPAQTAAHPHVFVDAVLQFVFDHQGLAGLQERWSFDEMTSIWIVEDYDTNKDQRFNTKETAQLRKQTLDIHNKVQYFNNAIVDGKSASITRVERFTATYRKGRVIFDFFVPLHIPATKAEHTISIVLSDPTIYTDFILVKGTPTTAGTTGPFAITLKRSGGEQPNGKFIPETSRVCFRKK